MQGEVATSQHSSACSSEIAGQNLIVARVEFPGGGAKLGLVSTKNTRTRLIERQWSAIAQSSGGDSRQMRYRIENLFLHRRDLFVAIAGEMQIKNSQCGAPRLKSERSSERALKAAQRNEAGGDEQTAYCDLHPEQEVTESKSCRTHLRSSASEDVIGIGLPDLSDRHASENQAGAHRDQQGECIQSAVWLH